MLLQLNRRQSLKKGAAEKERGPGQCGGAGEASQEERVGDEVLYREVRDRSDIVGNETS
jgi:hypothetical protein